MFTNVRLQKKPRTDAYPRTPAAAPVQQQACEPHHVDSTLSGILAPLQVNFYERLMLSLESPLPQFYAQCEQERIVFPEIDARSRKVWSCSD